MRLHFNWRTNAAINSFFWFVSVAKERKKVIDEIRFTILLCTLNLFLGIILSLLEILSLKFFFFILLCPRQYLCFYITIKCKFNKVYLWSTKGRSQQNIFFMVKTSTTNIILVRDRVKEVLLAETEGWAACW